MLGALQHLLVLQKKRRSRQSHQPPLGDQPQNGEKRSGASDSVLARGKVPRNYQRTLRPLYRLNFSSQVITGISSHKAWAMI
jgi:hypothetical protein